ncbi:MAG: TrmH family RNA methyltransferase [Chloroflexota bacterium]
MAERPLLTSPSNPLVKQARALRGRKARAESGLFLVEGLHHVGAALEAGWDVDALLYAPDLLTGDFAASLLEDACRLGLAPQPVSAKIMESLAGKDNPQGVLALVKQRAASLSGLAGFRCGAALVSPQDPGNVGATLRTLDAVGADALFLLDPGTGGGVDPYHPTLVRASMGALFWKPVVQVSFEEFVPWAKVLGCRLIASSAHASLDYRAYRPDDSPWVLVLGSEQKGLSAEQLAACDLALSLPMRGKASSLNLAVAAGILLYALKV